MVPSNTEQAMSRQQAGKGYLKRKRKSKHTVDG